MFKNLLNPKWNENYADYSNLNIFILKSLISSMAPLTLMQQNRLKDSPTLNTSNTG
jgi:hypothetical protein